MGSFGCSVLSWGSKGEKQAALESPVPIVIRQARKNQHHKVGQAMALYQISSHGPNRGLGPIRDADLAKNVLYMFLDGFIADP